jgi:hypothetical protein
MPCISQEFEWTGMMTGNATVDHHVGAPLGEVDGFAVGATKLEHQLRLCHVEGFDNLYH